MTVETVCAHFGPDQAILLMFQILSGYILNAGGDFAFSEESASFGPVVDCTDCMDWRDVAMKFGVVMAVMAETMSTALFCRVYSTAASKSRVQTAHRPPLFFCFLLCTLYSVGQFSVLNTQSSCLYPMCSKPTLAHSQWHPDSGTGWHRVLRATKPRRKIRLSAICSTLIRDTMNTTKLFPI